MPDCLFNLTKYIPSKMIGCKVSYHCSHTAMLEPPHIGLFGIFMSTVPHRGLDVPAVRTRGLFFLETRISQEMDETACTHQVSIGTLWWEKKTVAAVKQSAQGK